MDRKTLAQCKQLLEEQKTELSQRLGRVRRNITRTLDRDSAERALQIENNEVVDALGNEAQLELQAISEAMGKIDAGTYGRCAQCGGAISVQRLTARPQAEKCFSCATE